MEADGFNLGDYQTRVEASKRPKKNAVTFTDGAKTFSRRISDFRAEWSHAGWVEKAVVLGTVATAATLIAAPVFGIYYASGVNIDIGSAERFSNCTNYIDVSLVSLDIGRGFLMERFISNRIALDVLTYGDFGYQTAVERVGEINNYWMSADVRVMQPMVNHTQLEGHFYRSEFGECRMALYYP